MISIVINIAASSEFELSPQGIRAYGKLKGWTPTFWQWVSDRSERVADQEYVKITSTQARDSYSSFIVTTDGEPPFNRQGGANTGLWVVRDLNRNDPTLLDVVRTLGRKAYSRYGRLKIVQVPNDVKWEIAESHNGGEHVAERHRIWY